MLRILTGAVLAIATIAGRTYAQSHSGWTTPFPPFHIADNLYYVGSKGLANYLITTPQGYILINSDLEDNVPLIRASVGSPNVNEGYKLVGNALYPDIAQDYERTFRRSWPGSNTLGRRPILPAGDAGVPLGSHRLPSRF
jgi:hypothetical protein